MYSVDKIESEFLKRAQALALYLVVWNSTRGWARIRKPILYAFDGFCMHLTDLTPEYIMVGSSDTFRVLAFTAGT